MTHRINSITAKISSQNTEQLKAALAEVLTLADLTSEEKRELAAAVSTTFYRDHAGDEALAQLIDQGESVLASMGPEVAEWVIEQLVEADAESAEHFAGALGQIGAPVVDLLRSWFDTSRSDDYARINLLLAAGRFTDPAIARILPEVLRCAESGNKQVKSAAFYCVGRIFNRIPPETISDANRSTLFDTLFAGLADPSPLVRRHAVRAIGKGVRNSYFTPEQVEKSHNAFRTILGMDQFDWDNAFIVRSEAEYQLHFCQHGLDASENLPKGRYYQDFSILEKRELCANTYYFKVNAPLLAKKIQAGQFIIMRPNYDSERIPLSIAGWDRDKGYIEIVIMAAGRTSTEATQKNVGDRFQDVVGPLGQRSHVAKYEGACVVLGGGYGTGAVIPTARDLRALGNKVYGVVGARTKDLLILVDELKAVCDEVFVTTNDGSVGIQGFVTHALEAIMAREKVSMTLAVGPVPMMMAVARMTEGKGIEAWVSLNAIMVDGTGMCGACRVTVGGKTRFACYHGPDFNAHQVDFNELMKRQQMFVEQEKIAFQAMQR
ncbi:ferredoxin-NADP reductase [Candidatus Methylomirabilis lanthanidiphila]|uniref:Ferredoxin-NADP reductase n=1 Tax=Candidatus Methylomirabilis lanthanidiphila TaxID=2211376 RepID=A0A564ZJR6_9BACT|nr:sulfide/dihydroorotate dehydrogenase-like FAD/NAD-binding protein [Candidatus Methylomirabilis lanthanidiphila]VUZ85413.1 ferredoxin-NADP reductase [Candidatus Methylomirabilis lanthanidiphila]